MITKADKNAVRKKRHARVRAKVSGTAERPRLNVYRSNQHIYAQLIDDVNHVTLASASTVEKDLNLESTGNIEAAQKIGELVAQRGIEKGVKEIVFDRGGYLYHGKIKALAESAREAGLEF
ncbi:50S ribosomal protein L18 [Schinkia sp. CFF1]